MVMTGCFSWAVKDSMIAALWRIVEAASLQPLGFLLLEFLEVMS